MVFDTGALLGWPIVTLYSIGLRQHTSERCNEAKSLLRWLDWIATNSEIKPAVHFLGYVLLTSDANSLMIRNFFARATCYGEKTLAKDVQGRLDMRMGGSSLHYASMLTWTETIQVGKALSKHIAQVWSCTRVLVCDHMEFGRFRNHGWSTILLSFS